MVVPATRTASAVSTTSSPSGARRRPTPRSPGHRWRSARVDQNRPRDQEQRLDMPGHLDGDVARLRLRMRVQPALVDPGEEVERRRPDPVVEVNNGPRQECTIAPSLFNLYFNLVVGVWRSRCQCIGEDVF